MAGTLEISDELCWMPAGWVYDGALESIATAIEVDRPPIADLLREARTGENGGYLDLRHLPEHELSDIEHAADEAYQLLESEGPAAFRMPEYYDGFMEQFRALRGMLRARMMTRSSPDPTASSASPSKS